MGTALTGSRRVRVVAAVAGAAFGTVVVVLAVLPGAPYLPDGVEVIPFLMMFPLFGWAVIERAPATAARQRARRAARQQLATRPKWYEAGMTSIDETNRAWDNAWAQARRYRVLLAVGIPVLLIMWVLTVISIASIGGQPEHVGSHYYLDDHGSQITVTRAGYESAVAKQELIFAAGGTMFLLVSVGLTLTFDPPQRVGGTTA